MNECHYPRGRGGFPSAPRGGAWPQVPHEVVEMRRHINALINTLEHRDRKIQSLTNSLNCTRQQFFHVEQELMAKISKLENELKMKKDEQKTPDISPKEEPQSKDVEEAGERATGASSDNQRRLHEENQVLQGEVSQLKEQLACKDRAISELLQKNQSIAASFCLASKELADKNRQDIQEEEARRQEIRALQESLQQGAQERKRLQEEKQVVLADQRALQVQNIGLMKASEVLMKQLHKEAQERHKLQRENQALLVEKKSLLTDNIQLATEIHAKKKKRGFFRSLWSEIRGKKSSRNREDECS